MTRREWGPRGSESGSARPARSGADPRSAARRPRNRRCAGMPAPPGPRSPPTSRPDRRRRARGRPGSDDVDDRFGRSRAAGSPSGRVGSSSGIAGPSRAPCGGPQVAAAQDVSSIASALSGFPSAGRRPVEAAWVSRRGAISKVKWIPPATGCNLDCRASSGYVGATRRGARGWTGGRDVSKLSRITGAYVAFVSLTGIAGLAAAFVLEGPPGLTPLLVAVAIAVFASPFRIPLPVLGDVSIAFVFVYAGLLVLGTPAAAVAAAASGISASLLRRAAKPEPRRTVSNAAELVVSSIAAGAVFHLAGGTPGRLELVLEWPAVLLSAVAFFVVNSGLMAAAISLTDDIPFLHNWRTNFLWTGPAYVAGAFLGAALTVGLQTFGPLTLVLSLPLLYVLYFSLRLYAEKVGEERRHGRQVADLYLSVIEALALAIDAKDRTTQRHIRRVQAYAVALGRSMGLA